MGHRRIVSNIGICRVCGEKTEEPIEIFNGSIKNLDEKINQYLPIKVTYTDTLSLFLCITCTNTLLSFEKLVLNCVETNKFFETIHESTKEKLQEDCLIFLSDYCNKKDLHTDNISVQNNEPNDNKQNILSTEFCCLTVKPIEINSDKIYKTEDRFDTSELDNCEQFSNEDPFKKSSVKEVKEVNKKTECSEKAKTETKPRKKQTIIHRQKDDNADYIKVLIDEHVRYKCTVCGKLISNKSSLKQHFLLHTNEYPYSCEICGYKFRSRHNRKYHVDTVHSGSKKYSCEICGKNYDEYYIKKHMQMHNGYKFCCKICNKGYTNSVRLKYHMQTHTGVIDRPFKCDVCPAQFLANRTLLRHKRCHEKKIKCAHCTLSFSRMYSLRMHTSRKHTEQSKNDSLKVKDNTDDNKDKTDTADNVDNDKEKLEDKNETSKFEKEKQTKKVAVNKGTKQKDNVSNKNLKIIKITKLIKKKQKPKKKLEDFEIAFQVDGENTIIRKSLRK